MSDRDTWLNCMVKLILISLCLITFCLHFSAFWNYLYHNHNKFLLVAPSILSLNARFLNKVAAFILVKLSCYFLCQNPVQKYLICNRNVIEFLYPALLFFDWSLFSFILENFLSVQITIPVNFLPWKLAVTNSFSKLPFFCCKDFLCML